MELIPTAINNTLFRCTCHVKTNIWVVKLFFSKTCLHYATNLKFGAYVLIDMQFQKMCLFVPAPL